MNSKVVLSAMMAMSLTLSGFAFADEDREHHEGHDRDEHRQHREYEGDRGYQYQRDHRDNYSYGREEGRGAGPNHDFYRGERLPREYRHRNYVVDDWRDQRLSAPPRGYYWVQTGSDYVLVAIATGIIAQVLLGR